MVQAGLEEFDHTRCFYAVSGPSLPKIMIIGRVVSLLFQLFQTFDDDLSLCDLVPCFHIQFYPVRINSHLPPHPPDVLSPPSMADNQKVVTCHLRQSPLMDNLTRTTPATRNAMPSILTQLIGSWSIPNHP